MNITNLSLPPQSARFFGVNWALTTKCNYRCTYCHPDLHNGKIKTPGFEAAVAFVDKVFAYCEARGQLPFFEFGGALLHNSPHLSPASKLCP